MARLIAMLYCVTAVLAVTSLAYASKHRSGSSRHHRIHKSHLSRDAPKPVNELDVIKVTAVTILTSDKYSVFSAAQLNGKIYVLCQSFVEAKIILVVYNSASIDDEGESHDEGEIILDLPTTAYPIEIYANYKTRRLYISTTDLDTSPIKIYQINLYDGSVVEVLNGLVWASSRLSFSQDGRMVVLNNSEVLVFGESNRDGRCGPMQLVSRIKPQTESDIKDVVMLNSERFLLVSWATMESPGDVLEMNKSGQITGSYNKNHPATERLQYPETLMLIGDNLVLVADWSSKEDSTSIYAMTTDLSHGRRVLTGTQDGLVLPDQMRYDPKSGLLIIHMGAVSMKVYKVTF